jgi:hypothetical protein
MENFRLLHAVSSLAAIAAGVWLFRRLRARPVVERLAVASFPFGFSYIVWRLTASLTMNTVLGPWSGARLLPAVGLRLGMDPYPPAETGPALAWIYPPGATIAYLPASLLPDAASAILAGRLLSLFFYYAPVAWLIFGGPGRALGSRVNRTLLLVTFVLLTFQSRSLMYSSTEVHVDAPALGLGALAVGLIAGSPSHHASFRYWLALVAAVSSVWCKQLTVVIPLILLPAWAIWKGGFRGFGKLLAAGLLVGLGSLLLFLSLFDRARMWFHAMTLPAMHPVRIEGVENVVRVIVDIQTKNFVLLLLLVFGLLGRVAMPGSSEPSSAATQEGRQTESRPWQLFLLVGFVEMPLALMGYTIVGGDDNNLSYILYFLAIGCVLSLAEFLAREGDGGEGRPAAAPLFTLVVVAVNLVLAGVGDQEILFAKKPAWGSSLDQSRQAAAYIREHAGLVYFPEHPLEHLMVEGRVYHYDYGIFDRGVAGMPLTREQFLRHIPRDTKLVCYPRQSAYPKQAALGYLPGFEPVKLAELGGWSCYRAPDRAR